MSDRVIVSSRHKTERGTLRVYVSGYVLSVVLTLVAYVAVTHNWLVHAPLMVLLVALALLQFLVQLFFFLHLGQENRPRWKLLVLILMIIIVSILVFGSLWITNNLNRRMTTKQMYQYMQNQNGAL